MKGGESQTNGRVSCSEKLNIKKERKKRSAWAIQAGHACNLEGSKERKTQHLSPLVKRTGTDRVNRERG